MGVAGLCRAGRDDIGLKILEVFTFVMIPVFLFVLFGGGVNIVTVIVLTIMCLMMVTVLTLEIACQRGKTSPLLYGGLAIVAYVTYKTLTLIPEILSQT